MYVGAPTHVLDVQVRVKRFTWTPFRSSDPTVGAPTNNNYPGNWDPTAYRTGTATGTELVILC